MRNANKSLKMFYSATFGEGSGKVIQNPYLGLDHHQRLINSFYW